MLLAVLVRRTSAGNGAGRWGTSRSTAAHQLLEANRGRPLALHQREPSGGSQQHPEEGWRPRPDWRRSPGSRVEVESVRLEWPESAGLKPLRTAACCVGPVGGARPRSLLGFGTVFLPLVLKFLDKPLLQPVVILFPYFDGSHSPVKSSLQQVIAGFSHLLGSPILCPAAPRNALSPSWPMFSLPCSS